MKFRAFKATELLPVEPEVARFELRANDWNDWFEFRTSFSMWWVDSIGRRRDIGGVKIAKLDHDYKNQQDGGTPLPDEFSALDPGVFVSVAQDDSFYRNLISQVGIQQAKAALRAIGDIAIQPGRYAAVMGHRVVSESLLRSVTSTAVKELYPAIINGTVANPVFDFRFSQPQTNPFLDRPLEFGFAVDRDSHPPTNIHVFTGRNGSGKTTLLRSMARSLLGESFKRPEDGSFTFADVQGRSSRFSNLVYVGFSAFDEVEVPVRDSPTAYDMPYAYVGLQQLVGDRLNAAAVSKNDADLIPPTDSDARVPENPEEPKITRPASELANAFAQSAWVVASGKSLELWRSALETLESDPNFEGADVSALAKVDRSEMDGGHYRDAARELYSKRLSSGHRIVLLTITRLVETVTDRTIILMDEPEGHLHPPLLAAFTRSLSDLLRSRNGVAVIASHSPVILQEVPRKNVSMIDRSGDVLTVIEPHIETFGENVGVLTHAVFGLEMLASGFSKLLLDAVVEGRTYEQVVELFGDQLGFEARALLQTWYASGNRAAIERLAQED